LAFSSSADQKHVLIIMLRSSSPAARATSSLVDG